jgi:hypothetical protein
MSEQQQKAAAGAKAIAEVVRMPFGEPSFSWPDKTYATKDGKTTTHARVVLPFVGAALTLETVIWRSVKPSPDGEVEEFSVGLPRGINLSDSKSEELKDLVDAWKFSILTAFDTWSAQVGTNGAKARMAPRLVRKLAAVPVTTPAK